LFFRNKHSLLKLLWLLFSLLRIRDDEVDGIFWLLQQNSQFCLDLFSPGEWKAETDVKSLFNPFGR